MDIVPTSVSDTQVLELFSEHDDYMIDFLGNDKNCYTRYSAAENIEKVWVAYLENMPIGCIAYRTKTDDTGEVKGKRPLCGKNPDKLPCQIFGAKGRQVEAVKLFGVLCYLCGRAYAEKGAKKARLSVGNVQRDSEFTRP